MNTTFRIVISGDYACFTRPEFKVERYSYEVPTPGACEAILKSIYWKPSMCYVIDKIVVVNPIQYMTIFKNELKDKLAANITISTINNVIEGKAEFPVVYCSDDVCRRRSTILRDVCYGIEGHIELTSVRCDEEIRQHKTDEARLRKHFKIFTKRVISGKLFKQPFLGIREYGVRKIDCVNVLPKGHSSLCGKRDLGYMLYKMRFLDKDNDYITNEYTNDAVPIFYHPYIVDGIVDVAYYRSCGLLT